MANKKISKIVWTFKSWALFPYHSSTKEVCFVYFHQENFHQKCYHKFLKCKSINLINFIVPISIQKHIFIVSWWNRFSENIYVQVPPFFCKKKSFKTIKSISNGSAATAKCPRTNIGFCSLFNEAEEKTFDNKCKGRKFDLICRT